MAGSPPNFYKTDSRSACILGEVKVKGHVTVIRALSWILGMSYSVIDGLVALYACSFASFSEQLAVRLKASSDCVCVFACMFLYISM